MIKTQAERHARNKRKWEGEETEEEAAEENAPYIDAITNHGLVQKVESIFSFNTFFVNSTDKIRDMVDTTGMDTPLCQLTNKEMI